MPENPQLKDALFTSFIEGDCWIRRNIRKKVEWEELSTSKGWLKKLIRRYGKRQLKITEENSSNNEGVVKPFQKDLSVEQIYKVYESCLYWKPIAEKTRVYDIDVEDPGSKISKG